MQRCNIRITRAGWQSIPALRESIGPHRSSPSQWVRPLLKNRYGIGIGDPTFELRPVWEALGFVAFSLILFATVAAPDNATAIFDVSKQVSVFLPFLIMAAALGSQLSAIVNDTETRTEMLAQELGNRLPRQWTFPLFLVPAILVVLLTEVSSTVAMAAVAVLGIPT